MPLFAPLLGLAALGALLLRNVARQTSSNNPPKAPQGSGGNPPPIPSVTLDTPIGGTCADAVQGLPEPLRTQVANAVSMGTDVAALRKLAATLDAGAVMYAEPIATACAQSAACARRRADDVEKGAKGVAPWWYTEGVPKWTKDLSTGSAGGSGSGLIFPADTPIDAAVAPELVAPMAKQALPADLRIALNDRGYRKGP